MSNQSVITVTGAIDTSAMGVTLAHEHLFIDIRNQFTEPKDPEKAKLSREPVQMSNLGALRRNPYAVKDNLCLDDPEMITREMEYYRKLGGVTVVDCTSIGIKRSPRELRQVAQKTGLNIVAGCGYYTADTHPSDMAKWSPEKIADDMVRELISGIDDTGIRAGIIGEIGTSREILPQEHKNLLASARAFKQTGAAVYVHTYPWATAGLEASRVLMDHGVDPAKIVICHIDVAFNLDYIRELLKLGVNIEFDDFGKEFFIDPEDRGFAGGIFARDIERVQVVKRCVDWGGAKQVLITNDICLKSMLRQFGGWGYDHILRHIVPMLKHEGVDQATIDTFLVENPKRLLPMRGA